MLDATLPASTAALPADMTTAEKVKDNAERGIRRLSIQAVIVNGIVQWAWKTYAPPETKAYVDANWATLVDVAPLLVTAIVYLLTLVPQKIVTKAQLQASADQFLDLVRAMKDAGTLPPVLAVPAHVDKAKVDAVLADPPPQPAAPEPEPVPPAQRPGWSSIVMGAMQKVAEPTAAPMPATATVQSSFGPASTVDPFEDEPPAPDVFVQFQQCYPKLNEAEARTAFNLLRKGTAP